MKLSIPILILTFVPIQFQVRAQVVDMKSLLHPRIEEGQCYSIADTKVYLKDIQSRRVSDEIINSIGMEKINHLQNSEKETYFFCQVKCHLNNTNHFIWNTQWDRNENFSSMQGFVCQGLEITDVPLSSTLSVKTTVAKPFEIANSSQQDLRAYLHKIAYRIPESKLKQYRSHFVAKVHTVANAYLQSQNSELIAAGTELSHYNFSDAELTSKLLLSKIKYLSALHWNKTFSPIDILKKDNLVDLFLIENAKFFEFSELADSK